MSILHRARSHLAVLRQGRRNQKDLPSWLVRRPQWAAAVGFTETALLSMGRVDPQLKTLAVAKAAMMVNCEFCLDIGSAIAQHEGVSEAKLQALSVFEDSPDLSDVEKLVVGYAKALSSTPATVPEGMRAELLRRFGRAGVAELTAEITWENQRGRFNQGLGIRPAGFSDGAFCMVPESAR